MSGTDLLPVTLLFSSSQHWWLSWPPYVPSQLTFLLTQISMHGTKDSSFYNTNIYEWDLPSSCDLVILFFSALKAAMAALCSVTTCSCLCCRAFRSNSRLALAWDEKREERKRNMKIKILWSEDAANFCMIDNIIKRHIFWLRPTRPISSLILKILRITCYCSL